METQTFSPRKSLVERHLNKDQPNQSGYSLIEWPKSISKKRVFETAWSQFRGCGICRFCTFKDALWYCWKWEKDMIKAGGCIYYPYIMSN